MANPKQEIVKQVVLQNISQKLLIIFLIVPPFFYDERLNNS